MQTIIFFYLAQTKINGTISSLDRRWTCSTPTFSWVFTKSNDFRENSLFLRVWEIIFKENKYFNLLDEVKNTTWWICIDNSTSLGVPMAFSEPHHPDLKMTTVILEQIDCSASNCIHTKHLLQVSGYLMPPFQRGLPRLHNLELDNQLLPPPIFVVHFLSTRT